MIKIFIKPLQIETVARDISDVPVAVYEALISFYIASERFGQGFERELSAASIDAHPCVMD